MSVAATTTTGARPTRAGRRLRVPAWLGTVPFLGYVGVFLLWPTGILVVNAFKNPSGTWNFGSLSALWSPVVRGYFIGSFKLCVLSAVAGAVFGALVAYAVASGKPDGVMRRFALAGSGVLAQFGGVTLAFAFQALDRPGRAAVARQLVLRLPVVHRADLHLLPDPAHGAGVPARHRRAQAPVARGVGEPGLVELAVLAVRGRPAARPGVHRRLPAAVRQRALRVRHHPGVGEPDRLHGAAADQHRTVQRGRAG